MHVRAVAVIYRLTVLCANDERAGPPAPPSLGHAVSEVVTLFSRHFARAAPQQFAASPATLVNTSEKASDAGFAAVQLNRPGNRGGWLV
jgi:hypothetical protein